MVHGASRIAIGFVPFVGPAVDICEAVTGKEFCMPSGRTLTTGERVFSGIGFGVGKIVKVWKGVSSAAISTEGKAAAAAVVALGDDVVEILSKARIQNWKTLTRGAITAPEKLANDFEKKVILALIQKKEHKVLAMGDGVEKILRTEADVGADAMKSADFLTVSPQGGLIVTEAKYPSKVTWRFGVDCHSAVQQLKTSMDQAVKKGVAQDVELVQLAFPKGAALAITTIKKNGAIVAEFRYAIDNGYLLENGKRILMPGKPDFFVKVLELEVTPP